MGCDGHWRAQTFGAGSIVVLAHEQGSVAEGDMVAVLPLEGLI